MGWNDLSTKEQANWKKKNFDMSKTVTESQLDLLRNEGTPTKAIAKYKNDKSMQEALKRFYGSDAVPAATKPPTTPPTTPPIVNNPVPPSNIPGPGNPQMPEPKVNPRGTANPAPTFIGPPFDTKPFTNPNGTPYTPPGSRDLPFRIPYPWGTNAPKGGTGDSQHQNRTTLPSRTATPNGRTQPVATPSVSNPVPTKPPVGPQFSLTPNGLPAALFSPPPTGGTGDSQHQNRTALPTRK